MNDRQLLKNWARNCHYDGMICVKEVKGKRWMDSLNWLEYEFDWDSNDYDDINLFWKKILWCLNEITDEQVDYLNHKRYNFGG